MRQTDFLSLLTQAVTTVILTPQPLMRLAWHPDKVSPRRRPILLPLQAMFDSPGFILVQLVSTMLSSPISMSDLKGTHSYRQVSIWLTGRPHRPHLFRVCFKCVLQYQCGRATHYPCTAYSFNHVRAINPSHSLRTNYT